MTLNVDGRTLQRERGEYTGKSIFKNPGLQNVLLDLGRIEGGLGPAINLPSDNGNQVIFCLAVPESIIIITASAIQSKTRHRDTYRSSREYGRSVEEDESSAVTHSTRFG